MKKVLSLFALCAMVAFAGCAKKKGEEKPKYMKKEHVKKAEKSKKHPAKKYKEKQVEKKSCKSCKKDMTK